MGNKIGDLRIWHNSNFGNEPFIQHVKSLIEAKKILNLLANYDLYQGDKVTDNAQGLEIFVGNDVKYETNNGWEEWSNDDDETIDELEDDYFEENNIQKNIFVDICVKLFNQWSVKMDEIYTDKEDRYNAACWTDGSPSDWMKPYNQYLFEAWVAFDGGDPFWEQLLIPLTKHFE